MQPNSTLMTCILVDDEPLAREGLEMKISRIAYLELVGQFQNGLDANQFLMNNEVNLIFLDIQMPDITGLELLHTLPNPPMVIFTTAYPQFALDSYELNAIDYLLKPIDFQRFVKAVNKAKEIHDLRTRGEHHLESVHDTFMYIRADRQFIKIYFEEIRYLEGMKNYVMFHTRQGKFMTAISLAQTLDMLPSHTFARVNRSYILNIHVIRSIQQDFIILDDGLEIPFGRAYQEEFIRDYVKKNLLERK